MLTLNEIRLKIADFLNIIIFENKLILINIWSIVHLIFGALIMFILILTKLKRVWRYLILIVLLVGFEIVEFFLYTNLTQLFIPETFVDVIWDLIIGLIGAGIIDLIYSIRKIMDSKGLNNIKA